MDEAKEEDDRKPKLTVEEQIEHLKSKGVAFELCDEKEAARILSEQDHYFRLAAYRVLFPKRIGGAHDGEYAGLDFGHLVDLAGIDQELRGFLLPLTLDVESAAKTKLVERITEDPGEDGYSVFADYLAHLNHADRNRRKGEISRLGERRLPRAPRRTLPDRRDARMGVPGAVVVRGVRRLLPLLRRPMGRYFDERRALPAQKGQFPKKWRRPLERDDKRARRRLESPFGQNHGNGLRCA